LDPAPVPLDWSAEIRLDIEDAEFIDIIHTEVAFIEQMGHADFYPNGGLGPQPGCSNSSNYFIISINLNKAL